MRGFNPSLPTDQLSKYKESQHGILLLQEKDSKAAQCVSCHGVHGIRGPKSRQSKVHPQAIPETCGHCHADAKYMAGYKKDDGTPLPTDQLEKYKQSVHGKALLEKGDLGAPACNSCHGNHAAMPPKVSSRLAGLPHLPFAERHLLRREQAQAGVRGATAGRSARSATASTTSRRRRTR